MVKKALTTGQVADLCCVSQRTVAKWCDTGILECFRIPAAAAHRRVTVAALRKFADKYGMSHVVEKLNANGN